MDFKLDPYVIGGVIAISGGGYLIIKAYNNYSAVSVWNTIGMITVGSAFAWAGVRIFSAKSTGEKQEQTKKIKEDVTKAIAAVGEESAEVAAAEGEHPIKLIWDCSKCGGLGYNSTADEPLDEDGESMGPEHCPKCGGTGTQKDHDKRYHGAESYEAEFSESQREKLAKKGLALPDGSFPIRNKQDLKNAIKSSGLSKNKAAAKKFIKLRAKQLGAMKELPKTW